MAVENIANSADFKDKVLGAAQPVLVDFWASWCGPCKMVAPELEAVAADYSGKAAVVKVNVDEQQELAQQYGVMSIPTILVFKDGKEVNRIVGFRPKSEFSSALNSLL
ncbi:MAG: thioredoxin [Firmicutes bacterium]|nr:thioredoxin [Bacillota bacterium]